MPLDSGQLLRLSKQELDDLFAECRRKSSRGDGIGRAVTELDPYGYLSPPLDGIWLRAPYLHNGSVATLRDLLNRP